MSAPTEACGSNHWTRKRVTFADAHTVSIVMKAPANQELRNKLMNAIGKEAEKRCKGVRVIVDSGACDHVMPKDMVKGAPIKEGKNFGVNYVGADGGTFPNLGEQDLCLTINNIECKGTFQLADIQKPVLSVSKLTENGCDVKFNKKGGTITTLSGAKIPFKRIGDVYVLTADIKAVRGNKSKNTNYYYSHGDNSTTSNMEVDSVRRPQESTVARGTTFHRQG